MFQGTAGGKARFAPRRWLMEAGFAKHQDPAHANCANRAWLAKRKRRTTRPRNPGMTFATLPVTSYSYPCGGFSCLIASTCAESGHGWTESPATCGLFRLPRVTLSYLEILRWGRRPATNSTVNLILRGFICFREAMRMERNK